MDAMDVVDVAGLEAALVGAAASKARFLALLGEFVVRKGWEAAGCVSAVQWLSWRCGLGSVAASEHVRVALALRDLPSVAASLESGALTWSKVRAVTRVASPASEQTWLELALSATAAQVERIVRVHRRVTADEADEQEAVRSLSWRQADGDASVVLTPAGPGGHRGGPGGGGRGADHPRGRGADRRPPGRRPGGVGAGARDRHWIATCLATATAAAPAPAAASATP